MGLCHQDIGVSLLCGKSRRNVSEIALSLRGLRQVENGSWICKAICSGFFSAEIELESNSSFECVVLGVAFLRQTLRMKIEELGALKLYNDIEGEGLVEVSIQDVFWTHDCVTEEMEYMVQWAIDNGYM